MSLNEKTGNDGRTYYYTDNFPYQIYASKFFMGGELDEPMANSVTVLPGGCVYGNIFCGMTYNELSSALSGGIGKPYYADYNDRVQVYFEPSEAIGCTACWDTKDENSVNDMPCSYIEISFGL